MKILLSAYACEPYRGSEPGNGWNWALYLANEGHDVHVLTTPAGKGAIKRAIESEGPAELLRRRLHFVFVDVPSWTKLRVPRRAQLQYLAWQRIVLTAARTLSDAQTFDIVHHVTWGSLQGGSRLWQLGLPFVFGPIGGGQTAPSGFEIDFGMSWQEERVRTFAAQRAVKWNYATRAVMRKSALVLCSNQETMSLANALGATRVEYFPDAALPPDFFPSDVPVRTVDGPLQVLWVGRLYPRKALWLALDAIRETQIPVKLTIVGDGPEGGRLRRLLSGPTLRGSIDWWGQVPWAKVREAYLKSHVFLFTSLRDSIGAQVLEAMAFGLPVVTLDHHGARDLVPDAAGIKVHVGSRPDTVRALARAIDQLQADVVRRTSMGRAGYEFARGQSWPLTAKRMSVCYQTAITRGEQSRV